MITYCYCVFAAEPVIVNVNSTSSPRIGEPLLIECTFDGIPVPSVMWRKDGAELTEKDSNIKIALADHSSHLQIIEATSMDNGTYECDISNIAGNASKSIDIVITSEGSG